MQVKYVRTKSKLHLAVPILWSAVIILGILGSSVSAEYVKSGIALCINTVIPAVFPFMLISSLIMVSGCATELGSFFRIPLKWIFGTNSGAACPIALGFLCGYPVGAISAADAFDKGDISKKEFEDILTFINVPSAAFVIGGVGGSMLSSRKMGITIYVCMLLSAIAVGIIGRPFRKKKTDNTVKIPINTPHMPVSAIITESISRSARSMLVVCACVITFSALSGTLCAVMPSSEILKVAVSGLFEVSSGAKAASSVSNNAYAPLLCASVCAWSGVSVHVQIISACRDRGISFIPFFISKAAQSALAPLLLFLYLNFCA